MNSPYLFTSARLGFRTWRDDDLEAFAAINADEHVMEYFPATLSKDETAAFITRLQNHQKEHGYCYFAVEALSSRDLIGFIGLAYQTYEAAFTPCTDIGWRLKSTAWGQGYAREGAKRCLQFAFEELKLLRVVAVTVVKNLPSERVMQSIGMSKMGEYDYEKLKDYPKLHRCMWYEIKKDEWHSQA